ncbi:p-benzoquinone reductase [Aliiroseovarius pelagivivens]|uniref:p-benzoquinone reductase n=1 Tax=Aliiroseovarius pelagivivens TaxID=1639690 RepID=A0A2R8AHM6_9RHOB|nr:flavodoxin family protein [Aliiroseovarius pelagivivens]SPF75530.1 p-benzoquinone reductase [Aliiroseovarius pelagivivens]
MTTANARWEETISLGVIAVSQQSGSMKKLGICIPYFSGFGHTKRIAETIAKAIGDEARLLDVESLSDADWQALDQADAIIFGAPTYMGSAAARFSLFLEQIDTRWEHGLWKDKIGAGFTTAIHPSGDKLAALQRLSIFAAQMGMIWVGPTDIGAPVKPDHPGLNRDGSWLGLMVTEQLGADEDLLSEDLETARRFGLRVLAATQRWNAQ